MCFARFAYFTLLRDALSFSFTAALLMFAFSYSLHLAFNMAATTMLAFALLLLLRVTFMTERRFASSEAWRALADNEKPVGHDGLLWARAELETMMLRFAKAAAGLASLLYGAALFAAND